MPIIILTNEKELVEGCLENNRKSQKQLYDKYSSKMYGVCQRYIKDEDDAKDALQESFIRVFNNLKNFKFNSALGSWITGIVINTSINHYRKSKFRKTEKLDELDNKDYNISLTNIDTSTYDYLKLIQALPKRGRFVVNLYVLEGHTHKEIAEMLNITEGGSKSQLSRARNILIKKINLEENKVKQN